MTTHELVLFDPEILAPASLDSVRKLDPRRMARNPVMFVVEVGSVLVTVLFVDAIPSVFAGLIAAWLWFTVLFANFAEAMAEGRGKAQAETLRKTRAGDDRPSPPRRRSRSRTLPSSALRVGDEVVVSAGEVIPADGDVIEGIASVDESAITGESAPVIRESGGDRSAVTGGTRVLSDRIVVRVTAQPGESFLDRMIALVEGREPAEDAERDRARHPPRRPDDRLPLAVVTLQPFAVYSGAEQTRGRARRAARLPHPDDDRRAALRDRHRGHGPARAAQRARAVRPRGRGRRRLLDAPPRQDRHDHARQPPGRRVHPASGSDGGRARRRGPASSLADETPEGRSIVVLAKERYGLRERELARRDARPVHRADADERRRPRRALDPQGRRRLRPPLGRGARRHGAGRARAQSSSGSLSSGGTPLVVAETGRALGVIHLKDVVKEGMRERFDQLRAMGIRTVMITGDNPLTAQARSPRRPASTTSSPRRRPRTRWRSSSREQAGGALVAMTGDGTNDAPALAQADVGVAMNTGTQAAKEAGNMVDLDSNPTKLIEVVEIGKQLLITRGALTTFSIANDVAKYFAIIPAMFAGVFPALDRLNIMEARDARRARSCRRSSSTRSSSSR